MHWEDNIVKTPTWLENSKRYERPSNTVKFYITIDIPYQELQPFCLLVGWWDFSRWHITPSASSVIPLNSYTGVHTSSCPLPHGRHRVSTLPECLLHCKVDPVSSHLSSTSSFIPGPLLRRLCTSVLSTEKPILTSFRPLHLPVTCRRSGLTIRNGDLK